MKVPARLVSVVLGLAVLAAAPVRGQGSKPAESPSPAFSIPGAPAPADAGLPLEGFTGIGMMFVKNNRLDQLGWTEEQIAAFTEGVRAALQGRSRPMDEATRRVGSDMVRRVQQAGRARPPAAGGFDQPGKLEAYLKGAKKRLRMQESDSGLLYFVKVVGRGARPTPADTVVITLVGTGINNGEVLPEISGENIRIKVADLLPGLREGVQMMAIGSEAIFVLPPALSFGAGEWPAGVGPGIPLTFTVTLYEVTSPGK